MNIVIITLYYYNYMKIRPHVNYEYCYYYSILYLYFKTNEQVIHNFVKEIVYFEDESERSSGYNFSQE